MNSVRGGRWAFFGTWFGGISPCGLILSVFRRKTDKTDSEDGLPANIFGSKIKCKAPIATPFTAEIGSGFGQRARHSRVLSLVLVMGWLSFLVGCSQRAEERVRSNPRTRTWVVAPVLNLSGGQEFDALKITDLLASEALAHRQTAVIPVNLTLAALAERGKTRVETPEDAFELARRFNADGTLVLAVTEFEPYTPILGLVLQVYELSERGRGAWRDVVDSTRQASAPDGPSPMLSDGPTLQIQRVFQGAHEGTQHEMRAYAASRNPQESAFAWRKPLKSQELFVRYCCWAVIRTMLLDGGSEAAEANADGRS